MANRIDGKAIAQVVRAEVAQRAAQFASKFGRKPGLHVVLVGEDPASAVYVRNKERAAAKAGLDGHVHRLASDTTQAELMTLVRELNCNDAVDGILVQLPLPKGLNEEAVLVEIDPKKDVDGFHATNVGALWSGTEGLVSCTPRGCVRLLEEAKVELSGARAVVIGRSNIVGKPVAALLLGKNATVTIAHSRTKDLPSLCREADVIIAAVGRPNFVQGDWIKTGAVVIDVGVNRKDDGKLCGDVDYDAAQGVASAITPVPGGVGPMTIAMLLDNTLIAAEARERARL